MAVVTITITDDEVGGCQMQAVSVPAVPENDDEATPAQLTGAIVMRVLEQLVAETVAAMEGDGE
jgi:hypothetical protein